MVVCVGVTPPMAICSAYLTRDKHAIIYILYVNERNAGPRSARVSRG
jgi:hypothetical protein